MCTRARTDAKMSPSLAAASRACLSPMQTRPCNGERERVRQWLRTAHHSGRGVIYISFPGSLSGPSLYLSLAFATNACACLLRFVHLRALLYLFQHTSKSQTAFPFQLSRQRKKRRVVVVLVFTCAIKLAQAQQTNSSKIHVYRVMLNKKWVSFRVCMSLQFSSCCCI